MLVNVTLVTLCYCYTLAMNPLLQRVPNAIPKPAGYTGLSCLNLNWSNWIPDCLLFLAGGPPAAAKQRPPSNGGGRLQPTARSRENAGSLEWPLERPTNMGLLKIRIWNICSSLYSNFEYIRIWGCESFKISYLDPQSIHNWRRYGGNRRGKDGNTTFTLTDFTYMNVLHFYHVSKCWHGKTSIFWGKLYP